MCIIPETSRKLIDEIVDLSHEAFLHVHTNLWLGVIDLQCAAWGALPTSNRFRCLREFPSDLKGFYQHV